MKGLLLSLFTATLILTTLPIQAQNRNANRGARAGGSGGGGGATKALHTLLDAEWEYVMREFPTFASSLGDRRYNDQWGDTSLAAIQRRNEHNIQLREKLKTIDRRQLSVADQLNYDLFKKDTEQSLEGFQYQTYLMPVNQRGGIQTADELAELLRFQSVKDYEDWIARLRAFPTLMDQTIGLMREGAQKRIIWPNVTLQRVPNQVDKQLVSRPEDSSFYKPFREFPKEIPAAERERLTQSAREAITQGVIPAYRKFKEFFVNDYLPVSFDKVGVWQIPRGEEYYAFQARSYTTTNLTPQQIHDKGLSEVARIRAEMQKIMSQVGFKGTHKEFFKKLRTDDDFYYKKPEELLDAYRAMSNAA
jgi:uncharacterized protein (DUF885 family)